MGIICCSCGRNMKSTWSPTELDQNNRDVTSIPGYVVKKNRSRVVKHGACERQKMCYHAKQMVRKARLGKHGGHPAILSRWYACDEYRKSLSDFGWREHHIKLYDRIALEKHIYKATRAERIQNSKHWILTANAEGGTQQPLKQRPDFAQAKRECKRLLDEHLARTQQKYRYSSQSTNKTAIRAAIWRQRRIRLRLWSENRLEVLQTVAVKPADIFVRIAGQPANCLVIVVNVGPNPMEDEQLEFPAFLQALTTGDFFSEFGHVAVAWRKTFSQPTGGVNGTPTNSTYRVAQHDHISSREHARLKIKDCTSLCHPRFMSHSLPHLTTDHKHKFPLTHLIHLSYPTVSPSQTSPMILNPYVPCDGPRQSGGSTQIPSLTGYEPKTSPEELSLTGILGQIRIKSRKDLWEVLLLKTWTNLENWCRHVLLPVTDASRLRLSGDWKMENYEKCWLHHCICEIEKTYESSRVPIAPGKLAALLQERGASAKSTQADLRKGLMSSSSQEPSALVKPAALFSFGSEEPGNQFRVLFSKNADMSNLGRSLLESNKDHLLSQAKCELMRQEHQVGSLNNCNSELQQHAYAQRLELQDAWNIESRRELSRLQEEWSLNEKVLRDSQIRNIHEMEEIQRAQEQRVDEISVQKLRENHDTIQKLTSQLQEMQEQMNSVNDSGEFHSGSGIKLQREIVLRFQSACNDSKFSFHAEPRRTPASWYIEYIGITGKRFW